MAQEKTTEQQKGMEIDVLALLKVFWQRAWLILLIAVLGAGMAFSYTYFLVTPEYQSTAKMYVNNSGLSIGGTSFSISGASISAAQSLVKTYIEILHTRSTLEKVIDEADLTDKDGNRMTYETLNSMISASSLNDTEIFKITVTDTDPSRSKMIANTITQVLPSQISTVVDGSSVRVVDLAVVGKKSSPSMTRNVAIGFIIGAVLICGIETILFLTDHYIHDEEYLLQTYNMPLLAVIPDLSHGTSGGYRKYKSYSRYGYGHRYGYGYGKYGGYKNYAYGYYQGRVAEEEERVAQLKSKATTATAPVKKTTASTAGAKTQTVKPTEGKNNNHG